MAKSNAKPNGIILFEGPSLIDGSPIVAIAVGLNQSSTNRKTGAMLQTYILRSDMSPIDAVKTRADVSICGDCMHRGGSAAERTCYVNLGQGPLSVYRAYKRGRYPVAATRADIMRAGFYRLVRLGTYGDPAAVPTEIWQTLITTATGHTGYTHQWSLRPDLRTLCMASVDNDTEALEARARGWRTFRVSLNGNAFNPNVESLCPASKSARERQTMRNLPAVTCADCQACGGVNPENSKRSIWIPAHGSAPVMKNVRKLVEVRA